MPKEAALEEKRQKKKKKDTPHGRTASERSRARENPQRGIPLRHPQRVNTTLQPRKEVRGLWEEGTQGREGGTLGAQVPSGRDRQAHCLHCVQVSTYVRTYPLSALSVCSLLELNKPATKK